MLDDFVGDARISEAVVARVGSSYGELMIGSSITISSTQCVPDLRLGFRGVVH